MNNLALPLVLTAALWGTGFALAQPEKTTMVVGKGSVAEIAPGLLEGYLDRAELLDSAAFVPAAPEANSARQALDTAWAERMRQLRLTPRWDKAIRDADLSFPAALDAFSCSLGFDISETTTPALYLLLRRSMTDIGLSSYSAKNTYQRERPFMVDNTPVCTPADEDKLRKDGSYPSGHTAIGWGWALILSELAPDRAEAILARGHAYGESRTVCNVHWYSDVVAGRVVGAAAVARLQSNEAFLAAKEAARAEIERIRAADITLEDDCTAEEATLAPAN